MAPRTSAPAKTELGELIREIRGARTLRQFAQDLGVSYESPRNWEQGKNKPNLATFSALYNEATDDQRRRLHRLLTDNGNQ